MYICIMYKIFLKSKEDLHLIYYVCVWPKSNYFERIVFKWCDLKIIISKLFFCSLTNLVFTVLSGRDCFSDDFIWILCKDMGAKSQLFQMDIIQKSGCYRICLQLAVCFGLLFNRVYTVKRKMNFPEKRICNSSALGK